MVSVGNFFNNPNIKLIAQEGNVKVMEYQKDYTMNPMAAEPLFYCDKMGVRKRQVAIELKNSSCLLSSGAMQWTVGNVNATTGIKSVGDLFGKAVRGKVTGESAIKPEYTGDGKLILEPTNKYLILLNTEEWNGSVVLEDGLFLACESTLQHKAVMRSNLSSAVMGGEGLFSLSLQGKGVFCIESYCPKEELIMVDLQDDVLKIDGNMAIAWSGSLNFTVEKSGKSLVGSAASGEGLVNVYRGTGKVLMCPIIK